MIASSSTDAVRRVRNCEWISGVVHVVSVCR